MCNCDPSTLVHILGCAPDTVRAVTKKIPGAKPGRPKGSKSGPRTEPTVYLALRVPERILGPFRDRHGRGTAQRICALMEADNDGAID